MKNLKRFLLPAFFVYAVIQLLVILYQVARYEMILIYGDTIALKIMPVDPYDAFRGRYIDIRFEKNFVETTKKFGDNTDTLFITFETRDNVSIADDIFDSIPNTNKPYLKVKMHKYYYGDNNTVYFTYPFNRFYMQENLAQYVDKYQQNIMTNHIVTAKIKVASGKGIIENVFVDNEPLGEFVKRQFRENNESIEAETFAD